MAHTVARVARMSIMSAKLATELPEEEEMTQTVAEDLRKQNKSCPRTDRLFSHARPLKGSAEYYTVAL